MGDVIRFRTGGAGFRSLVPLRLGGDGAVDGVFNVFKIAKLRCCLASHPKISHVAPSRR